jgi:hypothetical protein
MGGLEDELRLVAWCVLSEAASEKCIEAEVTHTLIEQVLEAAVDVHCHFTVLVMALATAFRLWQAQLTISSTQETDTRPCLNTALLRGEGTTRWCLRLKQENRNKVIVFFADVYGIFHLAELVILSGVLLHQLPSHLGSRQAILQRYESSP